MRSSVSHIRHRGRPGDSRQASLSLTPPEVFGIPVAESNDLRAIEEETFPFEALSDIAEVESWRKEVNRPLSHIHKWWAKRLGTVFRAIVLATFAPAGSDVLKLFYGPTRLSDAVVFDPFMGSGTTVVEALKLGARAIGRDINPVAWFIVRTALERHDRSSVLQTFEAIKRDVAPRLRRYYIAETEDGKTVDVLYYFWVKTLPCPSCGRQVDLFDSYIFAHHAYPKKYPEARAVCPNCGEVNPTLYDSKRVKCRRCQQSSDPQSGRAKGTKARCDCGHDFSIAKTVRAMGHAPEHRLYAKLVLLPKGDKAYLSVTDADRSLYADAERELALRRNAFPLIAIAPGYNTDQALGYNYRYWHEMFNARQLLGLSILGERIAAVSDHSLRGLFLCLLSGTLEFNNMFASYKGEGTGAVRHMFYHHILKPERTPLEANLWGTPKSSGSFSTLFQSRILRALDYAHEPFEIRVADNNGRKAAHKVFGLAAPLGHAIAADAGEFAAGKRVYLSCGDSSATDLTSGSIDAIISDPPFFDNVHYSQLADFFHVWQRHFLGDAGTLARTTTRSASEVQNSDAAAFTVRLGAVWSECCRVLKNDGLLVFTYHHSRPEGWSSILQALMEAGFIVVAAHPIKAEMSVAAPKHLAKEPIDLDIILVCRKWAETKRPEAYGDPWTEALSVAEHQVARLRTAGRKLSRSDLRIIITAQLIRQLCCRKEVWRALRLLEGEEDTITTAIDRLAAANQTSRGVSNSVR